MATCYYHNDMDGKAAAKEVIDILKSSGKPIVPNKFKSMSYLDSFDIHTGYDSYIFIVDISFTKETITKLFDICDNVSPRSSIIWIDHHTSSMDVLNDSDLRNKLRSYSNLIYFIDDKASGAALTALFKNVVLKCRELNITSILNYSGYLSIKKIDDTSTNISDRCYSKIDFDGLEVDNDDPIMELSDVWFCIPKYCLMIDDYDRWQFKYKDTKLYILGCDAYNTELFNQDGSITEFWNERFSSIDRLVIEGDVVDRYLGNRYAREFSTTFTTKINGFSVLCKNAMGNSFNFLDKQKDYDAVSLFYFDGAQNKWSYSIYSSNPNFNCKDVAEYFGGGGHKSAAGFSLDTCIYSQYKEIIIPIDMYITAVYIGRDGNKIN